MKRQHILILSLVLGLLTLTALHITHKPKPAPVRSVAVCGKL